jgi:hypothetical protein
MHCRIGLQFSQAASPQGGKSGDGATIFGGLSSPYPSILQRELLQLAAGLQISNAQAACFQEPLPKTAGHQPARGGPVDCAGGLRRFISDGTRASQDDRDGNKENQLLLLTYLNKLIIVLLVFKKRGSLDE